SGLVSRAMTKLTAKTCLHGWPRSSKSLQVQVGLSPSVVTRYLPVPVWDGTYHNSPSWVIRQRAAMLRPRWRRASVGSMDRAASGVMFLVGATGDIATDDARTISVDMDGPFPG